MIRLLSVIFLGMFFYGVWVDLLGPALLSLVLALAMQFAKRVFDAQDSAFHHDTTLLSRNWKDTVELLSDYECESAGGTVLASDLRGQTARSDSES